MDKKILLQNLADNVAERTGITKRKAEAFVRSFFEVTEEGLLTDGIVKVKGFGTTKIVAVGGRESVNINTGERFQIEGHDKISFTPDAPFRDLVNRPFAHFTTTILADNLDEEELVAASLILQEEEPIIEEKPIIEKVPVIEKEQIIDETAVEEKTSEKMTPAEEEALVEEPVEAPIEEVSDAIAETAAQTEEQPESSQNTEISEDMQQPIIIQNTIPEPRPNWWRVGFVVLATLVLMTLSYFAGYYRMFCPCEWQAPYQPDVIELEAENDIPEADNQKTAEALKEAEAQKAAKSPQNAEEERVAETQKTTDDQRKTEAQKATEAQKKAEKATEVEKANVEKKRLKEAAQKYRQMDGDYIITGVLEVHEMKVGDNLYKLARQAYGDKNLASYIVFHNQITNPDLIQLGQKIEIPQLTRK